MTEMVITVYASRFSELHDVAKEALGEKGRATITYVDKSVAEPGGRPLLHVAVWAPRPIRPRNRNRVVATILRRIRIRVPTDVQVTVEWNKAKAQALDD